MKMRPIALTTSARAPPRVSTSARAPPRRAVRVIDGADKARLAVDEDKRLFLVEGVVAERHRIGPRLQEFGQIGSLMPKPPAAFSPLTMTTSSRQRARSDGRCSSEDGAPRAPDDVANEQEPHQPAFISMSSESVST